MTERTFVDTNILIDLLTADPIWSAASAAAVNAALLRTEVCINDIVYAELSAVFDKIEKLDFFIDSLSLKIKAMPREALFLAGKAFLRYRRAGGTRTSPLPDFFIGAQASVFGAPLLTRDRKTYGAYFPRLTLLSPSKP